MSFSQPWILMVIIPFLLLLFFLKKIEKKRYRDIPTGMIVKRIGRIKKFMKTAGKVLWISAAIFLIISLARPQNVLEIDKFNIEGRVMILSVDLSTSMSSTGYSKTGRSSVDVIKELSLEFAKRRATTDLVGITAYGGKYSGRDGGQASIRVFPTSEYAQLEASIQLLKPYMLGSYTSIGEGIFLSVLSILDQETLKDIDVPALVQSLEDNHAYALGLVKKTGRLNNRVIILFTDGKNNAGIEPKYPLWLAKMFGIKVYFVSLESTGPTGLSPSEEKQRKDELIQGVLQTGGKYYEANIVEEVEKFYKDIDLLETARLEMETFEKMEDLCFWPVMAALVLIVFGVILETAFPRIQ